MAKEIKKLLEQYSNLQKEKKDIEESVYKIQHKLNVLEQKGYKVKDSVKGGDGGIQIFKIEGFPYPEYTKTKTRLLERRQLLKIREEQIEEILRQIEVYINTIDNSEVRRIITYRYINNMTWQQVSGKMGKYYTADGCRVLLNRFIKRNEKI